MEFYLPNMRDTVDTTVPGLADNFNKVAKLFTPGDPEAHTHDGVNSEKISHNDLKDLATGDPHPQYILKTQRGAPGGVATLDSAGKVPTSQLPNLNFIPNSLLGAPSGVATLDANGKLVQDAKTVGGYTPSVSATAGTIPVRDGNGKVPGSITGDAATVGGRAPGLTAGSLAYYDANGRVVDSNKVGGRSPGTAPGNLAYYDTNGRVADSAKVGGMVPGTTAGTIAYYDASGRVADSNKVAGYNVGSGANQIPVRDSSGKIPGSITGDAATVGGKRPGTAAGDLAILDANGRVGDSAKLGGVDAANYARKDQANTWTQRQTFAAGITDGDSNTDVSLINSVQHQVHTRSTVLTYSGGRLTKVEEKNGSTVVKTTALSYDANGRLSSVVETAGGVPITSTFSYDASGNLTSVTRA